MQHAKRSRGPAAAATFLLAVALTLVGAPASMAAPGCSTSGSTVVVDVEDGDAELYFFFDGNWKLDVDICGDYNFTTTYDSIEVNGDADEPNVITFYTYDDTTVTDRMVEFWTDSARADGGIEVNLGTQSSSLDTDTVVFRGASGNDYIVADDFATYTSVEYFDFYGDDGKDTLYGKSDKPNYMEGEADHDILHGGNQYDDLNGDGGRDTLYGMGNGDELHGGADADDLYGEVAPDTEIALIGSPGNDEIFGDAGNDALHGNEGADMMDGGDDDDTLHGDEGDDFLRGGCDDSGADHSYGDAGDDVFDETASQDYGYLGGLGGCSSDVTGDDFLDGGLGIDTVDYGNRSGDVTVRLPSLVSSSTGYTTGNGDPSIPENDTLSWMENAVTGWGDDNLTGNTKNNVLDPGPDGDDEVAGMSGIDTLAFLTSDCPVEVNLQNVGRDGRGIIQTYTRVGCSSSSEMRVWGIENVRGSEYDDTIQGNAWVNRIEGGDGEDTLSGMAGNDWFVEGSDDRYEDDIDGGLGRDTVDYSGRGYDWDDEGVVVSLDGMGNPAVEDFITTLEHVVGSSGYDYIRGTELPNTLKGLGGEDEIYGLAGNDIIDGGDDTDTLSGGDGDDILDGGVDSDADVVNGGSNTGTSYRRLDRCYDDANDVFSNCEAFPIRR